MGDVYTAEYLKTHEHPIKEQFPDDKYLSPRQHRDARARDLRKQGWTVKVGVADFTYLARAKSYWLEAEREKP